MNNFQFFILLGFGILLTSCSNDPATTFRKIEYTGGGDIISLPLPNDSEHNTFCLKAAQFDGKDFLYFFSRPKYQILVYDLKAQQIAHTVQMKKEGPNGVTGFKGFTVLERDRIIISSLSKKLYTINLSGEVVDVIDYRIESDEGEFSRAVTLGNGSNDIYKVGNKYIIPQEPPYRDQDNVINSNASKVGKSIFITVDDQEINFSNQKLSGDVIEGLPVNASLQMTSTCKNDKLYYSFIGSMNIYSTSLTGNTETEIIEFPFPGEKLKEDVQQLGLFRYYAETTLCEGLLYDHYRDKFYRMVRYGIDNPDEMYGQDIEFVARYPVKFSVFVMDKDLNPEKEVHFEGMNYDFDRYFIASDGFYLSLNNPENPEFDEDQLRFERIEL